MRPIAKGIVWLGGHTGMYLVGVVGVVQREEEDGREEKRRGGRGTGGANK
jgi:hypothetical protein